MAIRRQGDASKPESCTSHKRRPLLTNPSFKGQDRGSRKAFWMRRPLQTNLAIRSQGDASRLESCKSHKRRLKRLLLATRSRSVASGLESYKLQRTRLKRLLLSQSGRVCAAKRGDATSACSSASPEASAEANRGDASSACARADSNRTTIDSPSYIASIGRPARRRVWCCYAKGKNQAKG